jgi:hypothetical protein
VLLRWENFDDAGETGFVVTANQVIIASVEDFATARFRENLFQCFGGDGEKSLGVAVVGEAGGIEDGTERGVACEDLGAEIFWEMLEQDLDEPVFDGAAAVGGVEGDFAEVTVVVLFGMDDFEGDGIGVETLELGGHVVVVDEELMVGMGDGFVWEPLEGGTGEVGAGEDVVQLGGEVGCG